MHQVFSTLIAASTLAALTASAVCSSALSAQTVPSAPASNASGSAVRPRAHMAPGVSPFARHMRAEQSEHAIDFYETRWGVDSLDVKEAESGQMVRFSYRILDPVRAAQLNDKTAKPYLLDETSHVKLEIPSMENVGQLRQTAKPEAGKAYWMVFANKGAVVKRGDRVDVVIGKFQANGLAVR